MATASLGRLTLDLVARISGYLEPLSKAERETRRSTKAISESFDVASLAVKGFGVVMGGLSVAGVIAYSEKVITAGNDIQKFSKLANASTAQLQYYAKGAETAGISLESFADKMKDMQDRIGDFQQTGGGPLADFFNNIAPRVGVTIQQFQKLSGPEALQLFYNSLEKAGASTNDMKFYMEQIISDSSLLIPLLEKNGQGFKFWGDAAQKAGAIMSDEMVKSLADAKVHLQLMNLQWQGLEANLINGVVPVLQSVVQNWDQVVDVATVLSAILIGRVASSFIGSTIQIVANNIATQRKILADYELAKAELSATAAMVRSMGALNAETAALMANARATYQKAAAAKQASLAGLTLSRVGTGLLGIFGGPLGLVTTALAVGASFLFIKDKTEKVTDAFDVQGKSITDLVAHYNSLGIAKKRAFAYEAAKDMQNEVEAFNKAKEAFYDSAVNIAYGSADSEQAVKAIDDLVSKFKAGKISAEEFANGMDKLGLYTDQQILTAVKFAEKVDIAKSKMDAQKNVVDALKIATDSVNKSQKDQTKTVNDSALAWQNLTEKQRKYIEQVNTDILRDKYISDLVGRGFTPEKANAFADAQASTNEGFAYKKPLQSDVLDATLKRFNSKNYTFGKQDLAAIAKVQGIAKANNFAQIESLYGLPKGALAALVLQESRGNANAISPTGAKGLFQTTSVFRKEYGLTSRSSVEAQAIAAAKDLEKNLEKFGSIDKALMAYNAGAGGLNTYLKGGLSASKRKEVAGYAGGWSKWFAGVNDKTTVDDSILMPTQADILQQNANIAQAAFELSEKRKEVDSQYYSESEKLAKEHQDRIDKITQVYTGTDQLKTRLAQEDVLYKEQVTQLEVSRQQELNQLKAFETDRISQIRESYDEEIRLMQVSTKYVGAERSKRLELLERAKQAEIDAVKREEEERIQSAFESYLNETDIVVNRYKREREEIQKNYQLTKETREKLLQANQMGVDSVLLKNSQKIDDMSYQSLDYVYRRNQPNQAAWTDLENQYYGQQGALNKAYSEQRGGIFSAVDDENERNSQLLAAHEQYLQAKAALDDEFAQRGKDLVQSQHDAQMNIWQDLLTRTGTIFSSMAEMIKNTAGESSAAYKVMFLTNQSISMAQAMINTEVAATKAMAEGGYVMGIPMASAIRGLGYASVGLIAAQTIAGMAHNGIDNIPREGTWLLDGGERVLNPQQNRDLTNYLNQRQSAGSGVNVVINNYGNDKVQTSTGPDGSLLVEIGKMVDGAVDRGIQRNMKQGFPLDRAFQRK